MHQVFRVLSIAQKEHQVGPQNEKIDLHPQNLCAKQLPEAQEDRKELAGLEPRQNTDPLMIMTAKKKFNLSQNCHCTTKNI